MGDKISNTSDRLKELMEKRNLRPVDILNLVRPVCQKYNVKLEKNNLSQYISGIVNPGQDKTLVLAEALGVDVAWLMGLDVPMQPEPSNIIKSDGREEYVKIPIIGRVAAGLNCLADNKIIGYEKVDANDICEKDEYRFLRVVGDSMYPIFIEGDLVLVRCQTSVDSGSYAVIVIDGEDGVIKKIVYDKDCIELHSINPMYPVRRFEGEDVLRIQVFGLVKEIKRKF